MGYEVVGVSDCRELDACGVELQYVGLSDCGV